MRALFLAQAGDDLLRRNAAASDRRVEIIQIRKREFPQNRIDIFRFQQRRQADRLSLRLIIEHLLAVGDVLVLQFLLVELPDFRLGLRGFDDFEPVTAGSLAVLLGDDFHKVTRVERRIQRHDSAVDLRADALVADRAVDAIGKVEGRCALRQIDDFALRRKDEDFIAEQIDLERLDEFLGIARVVLPIQNLAQPIELVIQRIRNLLAFLVAPVRRNAVFRDAVHLVGSNLHLKGHAIFANDRRMQRLIHVRLRHGDIILEAVGHLLPERVHHAQHGIAVLHRIHQHANGDQIKNLLKRLVLEHHLAVYAVKMLRPAVNFVVNVHLLELVAQGVDHRADVFLALGALHADLDNQVLISLRVEIAQAQILKLLLDFIYAKTMRQRRVNVERLLCDSLLALRRLRFQGAHVVRSVRQFDEHNADILAHRQNHLADGFGLLLHAGGKIQPFQFGHAVDEQRNLLPEFLLDDLDRHIVAILHRIVKQSGGDCRRVEHQLRQNPGNGQRMHEIGFARFAQLSGVRLFGKVIRLFHQLDIGLRVIFHQRCNQFVEILTFVLRQNGFPPSSFICNSFARSMLLSSDTLPLGMS